MSRRAVLPDRDLLLLTGVTCFIVYVVISWLSRTPQVAILSTVFIGSNMISRTKFFQFAIIPKVSRLIDMAFSRLNLKGSAMTSEMPRSTGDNSVVNRVFNKLGESSKTELLSAIKSLQAYAVNSKKSNDRRKRLFKLMSWRQQKLCEDVGYLTKLKKIDSALNVNQKLLADIATYSIEKFGVTYEDFELLKDVGTNTSNTNYRVVESLGHFVRDWTPQGEMETKPMLAYIMGQLDALVPKDKRSKTCVVVPGSGLGRVAHEIAVLGDFGAVHAVEYSGLMHSCHKFMYSGGNAYKVFPSIHSCSNYSNNHSQFRTVDLSVSRVQPKNLHLHLDDFRFFTIPEEYENVVVVSAFFIDTAENLMDYFDTIQELTKPKPKLNGLKNGYWINAGPLKYGSAAQVELNADEISVIREKMGWVDLNVTNSIDNPDFGQNGLVGYVTDQQSMWQGFYGLSMWASKRKENERK